MTDWVLNISLPIWPVTITRKHNLGYLYFLHCQIFLQAWVVLCVGWEGGGWGGALKNVGVLLNKINTYIVYGFTGQETKTL